LQRLGHELHDKKQKRTIATTARNITGIRGGKRLVWFKPGAGVFFEREQAETAQSLVPADAARRNKLLDPTALGGLRKQGLASPTVLAGQRHDSVFKKSCCDEIEQVPQF
jgi:hypothetical protein